MSIRVMTLVWDCFPASGSELLAMLALADWCDDNGGSLYPSMRAVGEKIRVSEKQARRIIHKFVEQGYLDVVGNATGGAPGSTKQFRLNLQKLAEISQTAPMGVTPPMGVPDGSHGCPETAPMGGSQTVIEPSITTNISISACEPASVKKTEGAKRGQKKSASEDFSGAIDGVPDALLADWLEVRKAKRAGPLTATAIAGLLREAAAAGLTPAQAVAHCCECGWAGFRADWLANRQRPADGKSAGHAVDHQTPIETYAQRAARQRMEEVAPMAARKAPGQRCGFAAAQAFMAGDVIDVTPANLRLQG